MPVNLGANRKVAVILPHAEAKRLEQQADRERRTLSSMARRLILDGLESAKTHPDA